MILDLHFTFFQSICFAIFLSSLFEFILLHNSWWYGFLQRHCKSDDVALETGLAEVPDDDAAPIEPGQFQMSEIPATGTIGAYINLVSY